MRTIRESVAAVRRKLAALNAVTRDKGATANEKANAEALKGRLERWLRSAGEPAGDWTDTIFRLGQRVGELRKSTSPLAPKGDWTDHAFRLGKALRRLSRRRPPS